MAKKPSWWCDAMVHYGKIDNQNVKRVSFCSDFVTHLSGSAKRDQKICKGYQPPGAFQGVNTKYSRPFLKFCNVRIPRLVLMTKISFYAKIFLKASNPKMIVQNVAQNKKMHIYSKFGAIWSHNCGFQNFPLCISIFCLLQKAKIQNGG